MPKTSVRRAASTTTRSRSGNSTSRFCQRACRRRRCGGYGSVNQPGSFRYPAATIEAKADRPVRVKWINDLKDPHTGKFLPHIFPVDQTLHWANPPQDCIDGSHQTDCRGKSQALYTGPVPIGHSPSRSSRQSGERRLSRGMVPLPQREQHSRGVREARVAFRPDPRRPKCARCGAVPVSQRPARHDPVVSRPQPRHDPRQRANGSDGFLPDPGRGRRSSRRGPCPTVAMRSRS